MEQVSTRWYSQLYVQVLIGIANQFDRQRYWHHRDGQVGRVV
ncbi:hypothetical protein [Pseudomonas sp. NPDC088444]